jgi:hypothetical protein
MVRALLRLLTPGLGGQSRRITKLVRAAARELSELRDAHALLATWHRACSVEPDLVELEPVGALLARRAHDAAVQRDDPRLVSAVARLEGAVAEVGSLDLPDGPGAIRIGLRASQRRARAALSDVVAEASDEQLHELRKQLKDLWYHCRLLRPTASILLDGHERALHGLSNALGDDHDLAVLISVVAGNDEAVEPATVDQLVLLLHPLRHELQERSLPMAERLLAESPKAFARRLSSYLSLWYEHGDELPVGGLDEVLPN